MTANLEARKLSIVERLADLSDEAVLQQIENLLKPSVDFWDELSDTQRASIIKGLEQANRGEHVPFDQFMAKYRPPVQ